MEPVAKQGTQLSIQYSSDPAIVQQLKQAADYKENGYYENALEIYTDLADQNIPEAQYRKGIFLIEGLGTKDNATDYKTAFELFEKALAQGVKEAHVELGRMYAYGNFVNRNGDKAIEHFVLAGQNGKAKRLLGLAFFYGNIVVPDIDKAIAYLNEAIELGETQAYVDLGSCYFQIGEYNLNFKYTSLAAQSGSSVGWFNLGRCYEFGRGVKPDTSKAIDCYKRAGQLGIAEGWDMLKKLLKQTRGDLKEFSELKQYYTAIPNYSTLNVFKELGKNYNLFKQRALQKDPIAIYNLGMMNLEGRGTKKDFAAGIIWLEESARLGNRDADNQLKKMRAEGYGQLTAPDIAAFYQTATDNNEPWALYRVGVWHSIGDGVAKDILRALTFLDKAEQFGLPEAKPLFNKLANDLNNETAVRAFIDHHQAQKATHPWSWYRLGVIFLQTEPGFKGWEYLEQATELGVNEACDLIKDKRVTMTPVESKADAYYGHPLKIDNTLGNPALFSDETSNRSFDLPTPKKAQPLSPLPAGEKSFNIDALVSQFVPDFLKNQPTEKNEDHNL